MYFIKCSKSVWCGAGQRSRGVNFDNHHKLETHVKCFKLTMTILCFMRMNSSADVLLDHGPSLLSQWSFGVRDVYKLWQ